MFLSGDRRIFGPNLSKTGVRTTLRRLLRLLTVNYFLLGTIVLAIQTSSAIYMGVDSKVIAVGPTVLNVERQPKIHQSGQVVFAHAGLFKDTNGKLDLITTAKGAILEGGSLDQIMDRFVNRIRPQLLASLSDIRSENPSYFKEKMKRPLDVIFASARNGVLRTIVVEFTVTDTSSAVVDLRTAFVHCPGDCQSLPSVIAFGEHDAADRYLDSRVLQRLGPIAAIRETIKIQADATPDYVSLPATVWSIDQSGIHEVK